jgi:hypothetical protein
MSTTAQQPATTPIPVPLSEPEFDAFLLPHLSMPKRGPKCKLGYQRVFNLILWVLYTGMQWKCLPIPKDAQGNSVAGAHPCLRHHKGKDIPAFGVAAAAVKFAGLGVDRERRCGVVVERTPEPELHAALGIALRTLLAQTIVSKHVSEADPPFPLVKSDVLCHTWYPFRYVCECDWPPFTVAKRAANTRALTIAVGLLLFEEALCPSASCAARAPGVSSRGRGRPCRLLHTSGSL